MRKGAKTKGGSGSGGEGKAAICKTSSHAYRKLTLNVPHHHHPLLLPHPSMEMK